MLQAEGQSGRATGPAAFRDSAPVFWDLIQSTLAPFRPAGITLDDLEAAYTAHPRPELVYKVLIHENELYVHGDLSFRHTEASFFVFLKLLCRWVSIIFWDCAESSVCRKKRKTLVYDKASSHFHFLCVAVTKCRTCSLCLASTIIP